MKDGSRKVVFILRLQPKCISEDLLALEECETQQFPLRSKSQLQCSCPRILCPGSVDKGEILILFLQSLNEEDQQTFGEVENLQPVVLQVEDGLEHCELRQ